VDDTGSLYLERSINNLYFSIQCLINIQNVTAFLPSDNKSDNERQKEASRLYFIELLYSFGQHSRSQVFALVGKRVHGFIEGPINFHSSTCWENHVWLTPFYNIPISQLLPYSLR